MSRRTALTVEVSTVILGTDCLIEVECELSPPWRGARDRKTGVKLEPDEPGEVEVIDAHVIEWYGTGNGKTIVTLHEPLPIDDTSTLDYDRICELVGEQMTARWEGEQEARAEAGAW